MDNAEQQALLYAFMDVEVPPFVDFTAALWGAAKMLELVKIAEDAK